MVELWHKNIVQDTIVNKWSSGHFLCHNNLIEQWMWHYLWLVQVYWNINLINFTVSMSTSWLSRIRIKLLQWGNWIHMHWNNKIYTHSHIGLAWIGGACLSETVANLIKLLLQNWFCFFINCVFKKMYNWINKTHIYNKKAFYCSQLILHFIINLSCII